MSTVPTAHHDVVGGRAPRAPVPQAQLPPPRGPRGTFPRSSFLHAHAPVGGTGNEAALLTAECGLAPADLDAALHVLAALAVARERHDLLLQQQQEEEQEQAQAQETHNVEEPARLWRLPRVRHLCALAARISDAPDAHTNAAAIALARARLAHARQRRLVDRLGRLRENILAMLAPLDAGRLDAGAPLSSSRDRALALERARTFFPAQLLRTLLEAYLRPRLCGVRAPADLLAVDGPLAREAFLEDPRVLLCRALLADEYACPEQGGEGVGCLSLTHSLQAPAAGLSSSAQPLLAVVAAAAGDANAASARVPAGPDAVPPRLRPPSAAECRRRCLFCRCAFSETRDPALAHLCPTCAVVSRAKRVQTAPMRGRVALVTGGRIKIGFQTALKLLRAGATVVVTTRFPTDAVRRFLREDDAKEWAARLHVVFLDLLWCIPKLQDFVTQLDARLPHLDVVVHNAAQTIRRDPSFYREQIEMERQTGRLLEWWDGGACAAGVADACVISKPPADVDADGQPVDTRANNSWVSLLSELSPDEILEVFAVNAVAPMALNALLLPLLVRSPHTARFVVNVSAMEGKFSRHKTPFHPHTNAAKAALNMMTRTSAQEYARHGVFMNSVDTGWVTDERPIERRERRPTAPERMLDAVEGAARVCDPIFEGINSARPRYGLFLKNYTPTSW